MCFLQNLFSKYVFPKCILLTCFRNHFHRSFYTWAIFSEVSLNEVCEAQGCTRRSFVLECEASLPRLHVFEVLCYMAVGMRENAKHFCTCRKYWLLTMRNSEPQGCTRRSLVLECVRTHVFEVLRYTIANIIVQSLFCTCSQGCTHSKSYGWNANISTRAGSYKVITLLVGTSLSRSHAQQVLYCVRIHDW